MTAGEESVGSMVSEVLQELEALRDRLERASEWFKDPGSTLRVAVLAEDVECLCREASGSDNPLEAKALVTAARGCLDESQKLLRSH